ncbi:hypothetical protein [Streptococcus cuniculipharyngis]|uniref:Replicative helicase loading/DNA remodeling protein DnaB N-terminal winged helix domain-containing protein n=1 Tax=Streptococcus cuniculipharyngis TaxID=1562651 RepID=A0A5C5SE75_9STRE|nr:hypothetical protein [Streptococcus cuniculipharyngis]TWS98155.1 hypothetical protein FRX57_04295 [Streptococcus cuniculipharyngis]
MKASDTFSYLKNNYLTIDSQSLVRAYLPLMGSEAFMLYHYFVTFFDNGKGTHQFSQILNHLQVGMQKFQEALALLTALDLVVFYHDGSTYKFWLKQPLPLDDFFANGVLATLLEKRVGHSALLALTPQPPKDLVDLSKTFSEVFSDSGEIEYRPVKSKLAFDLKHFKEQMQKDGLQFANEQEDVLAIYNLSERFHLTWFSAYQLAKETAHNRFIMPKRMLAKKENEQKQSSNNLAKGEKKILEVAQSNTPEMLLSKLKKQRQAEVVSSERDLLNQLAAKQLLDEVINVVMIYSFERSQSANLNQNHVKKIVNELVYKGITRAEDALIYLRFSAYPSNQKKPKSAAREKSIPDWSNPDYKNQTSQKEKEELEAYKRKRLAELRGED